MRPTTRMRLFFAIELGDAVLDLLESYREMCNGLMEVYLMQANNRMSEVMKTLAVITAVGFAFFLVWQLTDEHPVVELGLFARRNFWTGTLATELRMSCAILATSRPVESAWWRLSRSERAACLDDTSFMSKMYAPPATP